MENMAGNQKNEQNLNKNLIRDYFPPDKVSSYTSVVKEIKYDWLTFFLISAVPETHTPPPKIFS